ncbi:MAG: hypothetical protein ACOYN4_02955 [Bacteroidales bacterium]
MATFNYTVDTQPMADEMSSVSRHVNVTTVAVVAMQTAVIAAESRAADHVCDNVNKGFYSLIRSQISQKLAKFQSEVESNVMQLTQQKKALLSIKSRMERDYNMIAKRYSKLFNGLNANLKNRIFELDKPTIDFASKELGKVSNRTKYLTATIPITQLESISTSQQIIASNIKHRGLNVINSMAWFIHEMNLQKKLTDEILINDIGIPKSGTSYIPVVVYECNRDRTEHINIDAVITNVELSNAVRAAIKNKAYAEFVHLGWVHSPSPSPEINSEFSKLLSSSSCSQRVKDLALSLFQANNYLTI